MTKKIDKLNPLKTKHEIEVEIDSISYKLTFKPINIHIQKKLDDNRKTNKEQYEAVDAKRLELKEIKDLKTVNDDLLSTFGEVGGITLEHKTALLMENKEWVTKVISLEKEIKELDKNLKDINDSIEDYYKKMFEECVSGEDRVKFQKDVDEAGISYSVINIYLNEAVRAAQEKK